MDWEFDMTNTSDTIYFQIAGFLIKIIFQKTESSFHQKTFKKAVTIHFNGFITQINNQQPDYCISFIEQNYFEILRKGDKKKHLVNLIDYNSKKSLTSYYHISIAQFEFILRTIIQNLLFQNSGFILHASACLINGEANIFTGFSGIGKSTIIRLLKNNYQILADDSIIIRKIKNTFYLYQTPITDKEWWIKKGSSKYALGKVFFLHQAKIFGIEKQQNKDRILKKILSQFWTADNINAKRQIPYILEFISHFHHFYQLSFRKEKMELIKVLERKIN